MQYLIRGPVIEAKAVKGTVYILLSCLVVSLPAGRKVYHPNTTMLFGQIGQISGISSGTGSVSALAPLWFN